MNALIDIKEAAKLLGVSRITLYRAVKRRGIPAHKPFGRKILFDSQELANWFKKSKIL